MGNLKWEGACAIAKASSASNEPAAKYYPVCDSHNITSEPVIYEGQRGFSPDVRLIKPAGFNHGWDISNIEAHPELVGFLLYAILGADAYDTLVHTITPADDTPWLNVLSDRMADMNGADDEVQRLIGARASKLTIDIQEKQMVKFSASGVGCDLGTAVEDLTPSIPTGATNEPLGWHHLQATGAYFKVGLNEAATSDDDTIKGVKIDIDRAQVLGGVNLGSNQPTRGKAGTRGVTFEITKEFYGGEAEAQVAAFLAQQRIGIDLKFVVSTNYVTLVIPSAEFVGSPFEAAGAGDDILKMTFPCRAFKNGATAIMTATAKDGTSAVYS